MCEVLFTSFNTCFADGETLMEKGEVTSRKQLAVPCFKALPLLAGVFFLFLAATVTLSSLETLQPGTFSIFVFEHSP